MKYHIYILLTIIASLLPSTVYAQDYNEAINNAVCQIIENNTSLAARRSAAESDRLSIKAENNLNDPEVEFEHQWGQDGVGNKWSVSVSQSFDWPGLYKRRNDLSKKSAEAFKQLYLADLIGLKLRATQTMIDYVTACRRLDLAISVKENLDSIYATIVKAYDHGEATILDLKKIRFERAEASSRCEDARQQLDGLRYELIAMNGGKHIDLSAINSYPSYNLHDEDYYISISRKKDPALLAANLQSAASGLAASVEKLKAYPGFSLGYIHNVEIGDHFNGLKVGLSLPFFSGRNRRSAALAKATATELEAEDYGINAEAKILTEFATATKLKKSLLNYSEIFNSDGSDNYLQLLGKSFDGGQISLINYLYEINYYIEAKLSYLELINNYNQTMASLNRFEE